jgi:hypothetical protein
MNKRELPPEDDQPPVHKDWAYLFLIIGTPVAVVLYALMLIWLYTRVIPL